MGYMKSGYRKSLQKSNKQKVKYHTAEFYKILADLENIGWKMYQEYPEQEITEEWVKQTASEYLGRELDNMEAVVVASKIWDLQTKNEGKDTV